MSGAPHRKGIGMEFFYASPDPMWVVDFETLHIAEVNTAAIELYGYTQAEFVGLSIMDLRPKEDRSAVFERARNRVSGVNHHGIWRHITRDGVLLHVDVRTHPIDWHGQRAYIAQFRNVTEQVAFEAERDRQYEELARQTAAAAEEAAHFHAMTAALPGHNLILATKDFRILTASEEFCAFAGLSAAETEGRDVFDVLEAGRGGDSLRTMLEQARASGQSGLLDDVSLQRSGPVSAGAADRDTRISAVATPVADAQGQLSTIVLRLDPKSGSAPAEKPAEGGATELDHAIRGHELQAARARVESLSVRLHSAEVLLDIGSWRFNPDTLELFWSDNVFRIYRLPPDRTPPDFDTYFDMVHPDDRDEAQARAAGWATHRKGTLEFEHRIIAPDGQIVHVRGLAEPFDTAEGVQLLGVVQDVTQQREAQLAQDNASALLRMAGEAARFGGWRVDLDTGICDWSPECAMIHDSPGTRQVSIDQAIGFYPDEPARERIRAIFEKCATYGIPFDEVVEIITARGRRRRTRAIGRPVYEPSGRIIAVNGAFQDITEYEEMRQRAAEVAERLTETLEQIGDAFLAIDTNWRIQFANALACDLLKLPCDDVLERTVRDLFSDTFATELETQYRMAAETGEVGLFEIFFPEPEGLYRIRVHPVSDGLAVFFRDITDEHARAEQLRLLEAAADRQSDMLVITDAEIEAPGGPRIVYVNPAFERLTGYSRDEAIGMTPRIEQGPQTDRAELDRIRAALERGEGVQSELINHRKDGTPFWKELNIEPIRDPSGLLTHWIAVSRDITRRKEASEALRESEERFALIARASSDAIWDWDVEKDKIWWGDGLTRTFGHIRDPEGRIPSVWQENLHPDDRDRVLDAHQKFLAGRDEEFTIEYRFRRGDGNWALVRDYGYVLRNDEGRALRMVGGIDDITERRQLEDRLRHTDRLEAVGQLTGGVAHDFNNLLTIVIGNAEFLGERLEEDSKSVRMVETIMRAAESGAQLTSRLLAFARRQPLEPEVVDVNKSLGAIENMLRRTLSGDIEIEVVRGAGLWLADIDRSQFDTAILNLSLNARDAMPAGGRLTIETANTHLDEWYSASNIDVPPGQYVMVSVSDTGSGMDEMTLQQAFEPFFTTKPSGRGNGMGLSMVWGFMKQTGGHVSIYSEQGEGTTVRLYLPRAVGEARENERPVAALRLRRGTEHILVVEDDPDLLMHAGAVLRDLGYRVSEAASGAEALRMLREDDGVELLFTDVVLAGGMNGRELADVAVSEKPSLKVLYTSGYTQNAIIHQGRLDPGVTLLSKPYRRDDLANRVREVLDRELAPSRSR
ncbi:MAG: PAS domain S-box protein [Roseovarius confluentis]